MDQTLCRVTPYYREEFVLESPAASWLSMSVIPMSDEMTKHIIITIKQTIRLFILAIEREVWRLRHVTCIVF